MSLNWKLIFDNKHTIKISADTEYEALVQAGDMLDSMGIDAMPDDDRWYIKQIKQTNKKEDT
jgi:hypothetical protein